MQVNTFLTILFLAFLVEGTTEYLIKPLITPGVKNFLKPDPEADNPETAVGVPAPPAAGALAPGSTPSPYILRYCAAVLGILVCIAFGVDVLAMLGLESPIPLVGQVITGILVGRGSNYMNDVADRWLAPSAR